MCHCSRASLLLKLASLMWKHLGITFELLKASNWHVSYYIYGLLFSFQFFSFLQFPFFFFFTPTQGLSIDLKTVESKHNTAKHLRWTFKRLGETEAYRYYPDIHGKIFTFQDISFNTIVTHVQYNSFITCILKYWLNILSTYFWL